MNLEEIRGHLEALPPEIVLEELALAILILGDAGALTEELTVAQAIKRKLATWEQVWSEAVFATVLASTSVERERCARLVISSPDGPRLAALIRAEPRP